MSFNKESDFEQALVDLLTSKHGWESTVLKNYD